MKTGRILTFLFIISGLLPAVFTGPGCANIIPPDGGPRDTIPPVMISAAPGDSARHFTGNKIVLSFDEYVDVQNIQENLLVSPLPKSQPVVDFKLKTVTIKLRDTLEANTTYKLDFGNAVRDYTEGNPIKNLTYIFSTGNYIDSFELKGKVLLAETGKADSTLVVMLHTNDDDSAVVTDKPRYIAKLDGKGNFIFRNLPNRTFYLYALKDDGGTRRFFSDKQLFAFASAPVVTSSITPTVNLYAYSTKPAGAVITNPGLNIGKNRKPPNEVADKRLKYYTNLTSNQQDLLSDLIITFENPLRKFDSTGLRLYTDTSFNLVPGFHFQPDSTRTKLRMALNWTENTQYMLVFDKEFADDSTGRKLLKSDTIQFRTRRKEEYGSLKFIFKELDLAKHPVLQFVTGDAIYKSYPLKGNEFTSDLFLPGEYDLRLLFDDNSNGVWDPGDFFGKHKQPEIVLPFGRNVSIKPGFRNEFDLKAPSLVR